MTDKELQVNEEDFDVISIDEQEATFQYTIVPNKLIRDQTISPNCRWLIIYLISNKSNWTIKSRQICEHTKGFMGRDAIRKALNEAIEAGYIQRTVVLRKTVKGCLKGYSYKVSSTPKFKKCLRKTEFQGTDLQCTGFQGPEDQGTKEVLSKELLSIELHNNTPISPKILEEKPAAVAVAAKAADVGFKKSKQKEIKPPAKEVSEKVLQFTEKIIAICKAHQKFYRPPKDMEPFFAASAELIEENQFDPEELLKLFEWAASDAIKRGDFNGWQGVVCCNKLNRKASNPAAILSHQLTNISSQFKAKAAPKDRKFAPSSDDEKTLRQMEEWMKGAL